MLETTSLAVGCLRYAQMTEEALEDAYSQYLHRQGQRDAATRRRARLAAKPKRGDPNAPEGDGSEDASGSDADAAAALQGDGRPEFDAPDQSDSDVRLRLILSAQADRNSSKRYAAPLANCGLCFNYSVSSHVGGR